ncbi:MAG TPA: bifunctional serine/threonine-protein kinase/formylglycine-generating enzyme family protein [Planctomycetota bacterium]|nr:bifunctional serine/threonine-protein kinase/formylglycine-generating enzyme family protein [Planctomycetota bacterium]
MKDRAFCPHCGRKYVVPEEELRRREGLRFRGTCRGCGTAFRVFWDGAELRTEANAGEETETLGERDVVAKGARVGKYEVEEALASGGSSTVYRTFDPGANRQVALKVLHRPAHGDDAQRFRREVEVQGNLKHQNLMPIFDHGTVDGKPYYTMELLHRPMTLETIVALYRSGRLPASLRRLNSLRALLHQVLLPVARAIGFANKNGVIHRDLKPSNVILDATTLRVYVIDFGICHLFRTAGSRILLRGGESPETGGELPRAMGTARCMPPEQARGEVSPQGDVWALGALLRYLVTGDFPVAPALDFDRVSLEKRLRNIARIAASCREAGDQTEASFYESRLEELRAGESRTIKDLLRDAQQASYVELPDDVDGALAAIIDRAMAAEPRERYPTAEDFASEVQSWLDGRTVRAYAARLGPARATFYKTRLFTMRNRTAVVAAAAAATLVAIGVGAYLLRAASLEDDLIRQLLQEAHTATDPAVQEARLTRLLVLRPGHAEAEELLATVRRFAPLRADVEEARRLGAEYREARDRRHFTGDIARRAEEMAIVLERRTIPNLEALPDAFPGKKLLDEAQELARRLRGIRLVTLRNLPDNVTVLLAKGASGSLEIDWAGAKDLGRTPFPVRDLILDPGSYVLIVRGSTRSLYLPFRIEHLTPDRSELDCGPFDPAKIPAGMLYVPGVTGMEYGDPRFAETPERLDLAPYFLDETEVTNADYAEYLKDLDPPLRRRAVPRRLLPGGGEQTAPLWNEMPDGSWALPEGAALLPVTGISLLDAEAFAGWAGKRLPTPAEWERAARGLDRRDYAFGMELDPSACNAHTGTLAEVGSFPRDRSPFGALDMAGNVAELTSGSTGSSAATKGGSFDLPRYRALAVASGRVRADLPYRDVGFRCAKSIPAE